MKHFKTAIKDSYVLVDNGKNEQDMIHVALASDSNYARYVGVAVSSVIKNNPNRAVHFHLFFDEIFDEYTQKIKSLLSQGGGNTHKLSIYLVDNQVFAHFLATGHFTIAMYYRLLIPEVLADLLIKRCIYIDVDVLCLSEIGTFFDMDLQGKVVGVVPDFKSEDVGYQDEYLVKLGWEKTSLYWNSGVMLIDIQKWHEFEVGAKFIDFLASYLKSPSKYPDQDILNIILQNQVRFVSDRFNWQHWVTAPDELTKSSHLITFAHFLTADKPWMFLYRHPVYERYFLAEDWGGYLPPKMEERGRLHKLYARYLASINGDKALIKKHYWIYVRKKLKLLK